MEAAMLTAAALLIVGITVIGMPLAAILILLGVSQRVRQARERVIARQVMLTDAVHRHLGAVVAPVVRKRPGRRWQVLMAVPPEHIGLEGRLVDLAHDTFGRELGELEVVLTRPGGAPARARRLSPRAVPVAGRPRLAAAGDERLVRHG
jgi:hypothetical protein